MIVCGRSVAVFEGSNPAVGIDVCLLWVFCVLRQRPRRRAIPRPQESYRLWCVLACDLKPSRKGGLCQRWAVAPERERSRALIYRIENLRSLCIWWDDFVTAKIYFMLFRLTIPCCLVGGYHLFREKKKLSHSLCYTRTMETLYPSENFYPPTSENVTFQMTTLRLLYTISLSFWYPFSNI
jgi:hypothetical protein